MKPRWCKTITDLLLCINFRSDNCLWSFHEGPATRFPAKQMRPINHPLHVEWGWNLQARHCFASWGEKEVVCKRCQDISLSDPTSFSLVLLSPTRVTQAYFYSCFENRQILR